MHVVNENIKKDLQFLQVLP